MMHQLYIMSNLLSTPIVNEGGMPLARLCPGLQREGHQPTKQQLGEKIGAVGATEVKETPPLPPLSQGFKLGTEY